MSFPSFFMTLFPVLLIISSILSATTKPTDPLLDDDDSYSKPLLRQSSAPSANLLTSRTKNLFDSLPVTFNFSSLGALLNSSRDLTWQSSYNPTSNPPPASLQSRSSSEDYPPYPTGGGFLAGGPGGSYGSGWGSRAQRVVYIAIPLNALSALLSTNQLNTLGVGSIYPSLPPLASSYGGVGGSYGAASGSYNGGSSYGGGGGGASSYISYNGGSGGGGAGYVSGLTSGSNYGPSHYGPISYDTSGPGLGEVLYGAITPGAGPYPGGSGGYSSAPGSYSSTGYDSSSYAGGGDYGVGSGLAIGTVGTLPCPRGSGYYRHPIDCNRFYRCVDFLPPAPGLGRFKLYEYNCPAGTVFSVEVWVCVWPYQPEAGRCYAGSPPEAIGLGGVLPPIPPAIPIPPPLLGFGAPPPPYAAGGVGYNQGYDDESVTKGLLRPKSGAAAYGDENAKGRLQAKSLESDSVNSVQMLGGKMSTQKPYGASANLSQSTGTDRPRCLATGFFSHPMDCTQFAQCWKTSDGEITGNYFKCPPKTVFNVKVPVCDDPSNVPDASSSSCQDKQQ